MLCYLIFFQKCALFGFIQLDGTLFHHPPRSCFLGPSTSNPCFLARPVCFHDAYLGLFLPYFTSAFSVSRIVNVSLVNRKKYLQSHIQFDLVLETRCCFIFSTACHTLSQPSLSHVAWLFLNVCFPIFLSPFAFIFVHDAERLVVLTSLYVFCELFSPLLLISFL